jgi:hypothetical protein
VKKRLEAEEKKLLEEKSYLEEITNWNFRPIDYNKPCKKLESLRRELIIKAAKIFENNAYFPEYCISDVFKKEKCMSHSQIIQEANENLSIEKPNYVISLKSIL